MCRAKQGKQGFERRVGGRGESSPDPVRLVGDSSRVGVKQGGSISGRRTTDTGEGERGHATVV